MRTKPVRKIIIWLLSSLLISKSAITQQGCSIDDQMAKKGVWKKTNDALMVSANQAKVITHIDAIGELFKTAYPEPTGIDAHWYRTMGGHPIINNGPQPYQYNSLYMSWYCNKTLNKLELNEETGTWSYAFVNGFGWFISDQYDLLLVKLNNQNIYFLPPVVDQWKGYKVYRSSSHGNMGQCIILLHNDQLPWKPITQQQYLQSVRNYWETSKRGQDSAYDNYEGNLRRGISNAQNNKYLKPEEKDKIIAGLQKDLDAQPKRKADGLASSNKYWGGKFKVMDDYIAQHGSTLQDPAILEQRNASDFTGSFSTLEKRGQMLVTVDPSYFNKQLPAWAAQLIVLYWRWDKNPASMNFKKEFEANFPVEKLAAMLDK